MKTKYFISIAAAMLLMLASLSTQAQDVYEYATITAYASHLHVSYSNGTYEDIAIDKAGQKALVEFDHHFVLNYLANLSKENWEVIGFASPGISNFWRYLLKRKVK